MPYLIPADFNKQIQKGNLNQVIGSDYTIINSWLLAAQEKATSYLTQKYLTEQEFTNTNQWIFSNTYLAANRVYLDAPVYDPTATYAIGNYTVYQNNFYIATATSTAIAFNPAKWTLINPQYTLYYAQYPQPYFNINTFYNIGDKVFWAGKVFTALQPSATYDNTYRLQVGVPLPPINYFPGTPGYPQWDAGVTYGIPTNTAITNITYWTQGDNRGQQMVQVCINLVLYYAHARISPTSIPVHIKENYRDAIEWLKDAGDGMITPNLPLKQPNQGNRVRYGVTKPLNINSY